MKFSLLFLTRVSVFRNAVWCIEGNSYRHCGVACFLRLLVNIEFVSSAASRVHTHYTATTLYYATPHYIPEDSVY
jgi:hypothetical protein